MQTRNGLRRRGAVGVLILALGAGSVALVSMSSAPQPSAVATAAPNLAAASPANPLRLGTPGVASTQAIPSSVPTSAPPIRIGAVFPMTGDAGALAAASLRGVQIAADAINAAGGVAGRPIVLDVRQLDSASDADHVLAGLQAIGDAVVIGTYSSELSIPVSAAAAARGMVYWESGAVADRLTARDLPLVFRVGASGSNLGTNSADFAAAELASRLGRAVTDLRIAIVHADDDYATSVATAADRTASALGMQVVAREQYHLAAPRFANLMRRLAASRPDVLILASHIPDGIAFRRAMLKAGLQVGALIGTTMAECVPDFATPLGRDVVGIFGSDRPAGGFDPESLSPDAYAVYETFEAGWEASTAASGASEPPAPTSSWATPSDSWELTGNSALEEALSGFTAAWALMHDVLPAASAQGSVDVASIAAAARAIDLPAGSLPNGAGLRFSSDPSTLGQNERAIGMIWQWQAPDSDVVVWPQSFATGQIADVPLSR